MDTLVPGNGYASQLRLQALIAAEHASAGSAGDTDWAAIAGHYESLEALTGSAIVRLNRAVAVAEAQSPRAALALLAGLGATLQTHHRFAAVTGELAWRAGDMDLACSSLRAALELAANDAERSHIRSRLAELQAARER